MDLPYQMMDGWTKLAKTIPFLDHYGIKYVIFKNFIYCGVGEVGELFNPQISVTFGYNIWNLKII